jgi:signal transduction histidine kinase
MLVMDADAMEQAILNLLTNAAKYSRDSREISLRARRQGSEVVVEVADGGVGIDPAEHARIFEKFYRARNDATGHVAGTGLGLTLVKHIVEAHGGHVDVESSPGAGSTFSIRLPIPTRPVVEVA